tara:strand:- start:140 stop:550 length:411 start_codon:yes stop_codon:yes gene_type:complete
MVDVRGIDIKYLRSVDTVNCELVSAFTSEDFKHYLRNNNKQIGEELMNITSPDEWEEFAYEMETVVDEYVVDTDRWHQYYEQVVKDKEGKFWELSWKQGATENQDLDFEECNHCAIEVEPYEVTVTKYKAIKLEKN